MTVPHHAAARTEDGRSVNIFLKLREPGAPHGRGHFGATSLAAELICAVLARAAGVPVPDYGIAIVGRVFADSIPNEPTRQLMLNNLGENFASVRLDPLPLTWRYDCTSLSFELRQAVDDVMSFDASVVNGDRQRSNPNLLWDGKDTVHVIDHGLACAAHLWDDSTIASSPLLPDEKIKLHCGYEFLSGRGCLFNELHARWRSAMTPEAWQALRAAVPASWERRSGDLERIFRFLEARDAKFPDVMVGLRRVVR